MTTIQNLFSKFGVRTSLSDLIHILVEIEHSDAGSFNINKLILMIRDTLSIPEIDDFIKNVFYQIDIDKQGVDVVIFKLWL